MIAELTHHSHMYEGGHPVQSRSCQEACASPSLIEAPTIFRALNLCADPFARTTPPIFAETAPHRSVLDALTGWIASDDASGFGILTAEPGCGTTTVLDALARELTSRPVACVHVTPNEERLTDTRLLQRIIIALGSEPNGRTGLELTNQCRHLLEAIRDAGKRPILLLDGLELTGSQLDVMQALTGPAERPHDHAMDPSVLFTGSTTLARRLLRRPAIRAGLRCQATLERLDHAGTTTLLAAYTDPVRPQQDNPTPLMTDEAVGIIADWTQGEAKAILRFAREAMLEAIATGKTVIDSAIARQIAREFTHQAQLAKRESDAARFPSRVQASLAFVDTPTPSQQFDASHGGEHVG